MKFHTHFYSPHNPSQPSEILMVLPSNYISKSFLSFTTPTRLCLLHDPKAHGRGTLSLIPTPGARQNSWHTGSHPPSTYWLRPAFPLPPKKYGSPLGSVLSSAIISGGKKKVANPSSYSSGLQQKPPSWSPCFHPHPLVSSPQSNQSSLQNGSEIMSLFHSKPFK